MIGWWGILAFFPWFFRSDLLRFFFFDFISDIPILQSSVLEMDLDSSIKLLSDLYSSPFEGSARRIDEKLTLIPLDSVIIRDGPLLLEAEDIPVPEPWGKSAMQVFALERFSGKLLVIAGKIRL
jgi:hypothetical protein